MQGTIYRKPVYEQMCIRDRPVNTLFMKISAAQAYCILDTGGSSILTKSGEISGSYLLEWPEAYSLDRADLEERHNELFRAFQYVRTGFIHKQDVFLRRKFKPEYVICLLYTSRCV